jgi:S1-C subfamily serine protease
MATNYEPSSPYEPPPPRPPVLGACITLLIIFVLIPVAVFLIWWYWPKAGTGLNPSAQPRAVTPRGSLSEEEQTNIEIYERISPSVVQVTTLGERSNWFGLNIQEVPEGVGSGFAWDQDGHIVTNYHVVKDANAAQVTLANHSSYPTQRIWAYPDQDIAVLWINAPRQQLHPIPIGTSYNLKVGQVVYALGNPFGLGETMTTGIISALGREIESVNHQVIRGVIQTSAAINPGSSGGPLLDSAGRLIGMNTAIISPSKAFAGIGFAIPVDDINRIVPQLIRHGRVVHPRLGVQAAPDQVAHQLGVEQGALILKVLPDSPAAQAGLQPTRRDAHGHIHLGDVIVAIDQKPIQNVNDLYAALEQYQVGDTVTLTILRNGERRQARVTLQAAE